MILKYYHIIKFHIGSKAAGRGLWRLEEAKIPVDFEKLFKSFKQRESLSYNHCNLHFLYESHKIIKSTICVVHIRGVSYNNCNLIFVLNEILKCHYCRSLRQKAYANSGQHKLRAPPAAT